MTINWTKFEALLYAYEIKLKFDHHNTNSFLSNSYWDIVNIA